MRTILSALFLLWLLTSAAHASPEQYRRLLTASAAAEWGLNAPVPVFAAQVTAESNWNEKVVAYDGGKGLAQFMPSTADWLQGLYASRLGQEDPFNPAWALRALVIYDKNLYDQLAFATTPCDQWAFTLSSYNGGLGNLMRDRRLAAARHRDPNRWYFNVDLASDRGRNAFIVNRRYPTQILFRFQPQFASWGPTVECKT